ncbi:MAG: hypothetical protein ACK52U_09980 [Synechococcaceae cyanobacterium]|jgi:hypothetical protein
MGARSWRSLVGWPQLRPDPRAVLGLGLCGLAWGVAIAPNRQPLEGALRLSALGFTFQPPPQQASGSAQGFLAISLRSLSIKGLDKGKPLLLPFHGQRLPLDGGRALSLIAFATEPLELRLAMAPGTRVANLQLEGKDQLVLDLIPPRPAASAAATDQAAPELTIISPAGPAEGSGSALQALYQEPGRPARRLSAPEAQFPLPLAGAARLRLQRALPDRPVVFEPNLLVSQVQFTTERKSLFDQSPITFSTLRSGTLHLGRMEPLNLRADQFLQIEPPGIAVLTSLRSDQNQLAVEVVGETQRIRSGLSQKHPTTVLSGTLLSRHLSPAQISGFFGFLVGVISSLVLSLFKGD